MLLGADCDPVAGANIVQQEVAEGMEDLPADRIGHGQGSAEDLRSGSNRVVRTYMTARAADAVE